MTFQSSEFFIFVVILWCLVWGVFANNALARRVSLLAGSYYFYMTFDLRFAGALFFLSTFYYLAALAIAGARSPAVERTVATLSVVVPLGVLAYFKYMNFFIAELEAVFALVGFNPSLLKIVAPVGISFFTFQGLAYVIDVRRKRFEAHRSYIDVLLFLSFFPSILSGPINRAHNLIPQIVRGGRVSYKRMADGFYLVARGFVKKIVFADMLALYFVDPAFADPSSYSTPFLILAVYAYTLQIYMDLSGYTDIARGVAKIFGFDLMENFRMPYAALTVSQFWQRWHISMSSFFRDYLFHGVGGSRYGNVYLNLLITFVAIGVWHGAGWNFVLYGLLHGSIVALERFLRLRREKRGVAVSEYGAFEIVCRWMFVINFVAFSRILFRSDGVGGAVTYVSALLGNIGNVSLDVPLVGVLLMAFAFALHFVPQRANRYAVLAIVNSNALLTSAAFVTIFYFLLAVSAGGSGFIYFAF